MRLIFHLVSILVFSFFNIHSLCAKSTQRVHSYIVADAISGKILKQKNADVQCYPASLTKKMTLYLLFNAIKNGYVHFNTMFKVSEYATKQIPSKLYLQAGDMISVKTIIEALIVKSANDVAVVAAEGMAGSVDNFVYLMNQTAQQLGMRRTRFCNPSGVPDKKQKTTARDMALLSKALFTNFPEFVSLFKLRSFKYKGNVYYTHNRLLNRFQGTNGIKTGYIFNSGHNISTSVIRYDMAKRPFHLLAVVLGKDSSRERDDEVIALLEPIFLKCGAVFYEPNDTIFDTQGRAILAGNFSVKKSKKKPVFLRTPIYTQNGMNLLLKQYLDQKKDNTRLLKMSSNIDSLLHKFPDDPSIKTTRFVFRK